MPKVTFDDGRNTTIEMLPTKSSEVDLSTEIR